MNTLGIFFAVLGTLSSLLGVRELLHLKGSDTRCAAFLALSVGAYALSVIFLFRNHFNILQ